jgi:hypothetical protein
MSRTRGFAAGRNLGFRNFLLSRIPPEVDFPLLEGTVTGLEPINVLQETIQDFLIEKNLLVFPQKIK